MVFTQGRGFVIGASFGLPLRSLRCRVLACHAADTASLATWLLFGKLFGVATLVGFGEKRCRKNLPVVRSAMKSTETSHFRAGNFASMESFTQLFVETYSDDDDSPISPFAQLQGETFYDHDFMEYGGFDDAKLLSELVAGYSYSDQWFDQFLQLVESAGLTDNNSFLFISESEIENPQSFETGSGHLRYLGELTYKI